MSLENYSTLTREEVTSRIDELESENTPKFEVYRTKNGEVIETFPEDDDAAEYIADQDYATDRVKIREVGGLDDAAAAELEALRDFDAEALSDIGDWYYGVMLYSDDYINAAFARERAEEFAPPGVDLDAWPYNLIDWDTAAEDLKDNADSSYATLGGTQFYYL